MTAEEEKTWKDACAMEKEYPGNPLVTLEAIKMRHEILIARGAITENKGNK